MNIAYSIKARVRHEIAKRIHPVPTDPELAAISRVCEGCMSKQLRTNRLTGKRYLFCGPPGENYMESVLRTCGCEVMQETSPAKAHVTIEGVPMRASGKPETGHCPQNKW